MLTPWMAARFGSV